MEHPDAEILAAVAMGQSADEATVAHLEQCEVCRTEVAELASLVAALPAARAATADLVACLLYTSPSPRDGLLSRMPSSA